MGLILALITYIGWGAGDIFDVYSSRKIGAYLTSFFVFIFGFLIASLYVPFALADIGKITIGLLILNILAGIGILVGIIVQTFPALVLIASTVIFKDPVTRQQKIGVGVVLVGILLLSFFSN